jgi:hypothetical protein
MYDDGGLSGGTMERPALKRLLEDIKASKVSPAVRCACSNSACQAVTLTTGTEAASISLSRAGFFAIMLAGAPRLLFAALSLEPIDNDLRHHW